MPHATEETALVGIWRHAVLGKQIAVAQQVIAVTIPLAVGVVITQNRCGFTGFIDQAKLKIDFNQTFKGFGHVLVVWKSATTR